MPTTTVCRLDNKETTVQIDAIPTYGESLRHSCQSAFLAAERVYEHLDEGTTKFKASLLRSCRSYAYFFRHADTGEIRVGSNACHLRWCPVCAQSRRNYISHSVAEWTGAASYPKFLTLTLRHSDAPLDWQIKCLYNYFRELRRRREFKHCVKGGIWFFQIKRSKTDGFWHPHLHCLIEGLFFKKRTLSRLWCQISHGSYIVDIRPVRDPQAAANDAAKYAAAPGSIVSLSLADAVELVEAMHNRRICGTWGTGRAVSLRPAKLDDKDKWKTVGSWDMILKNRDTDPNARAILNAWKDKQPLEAGIQCYGHPAEPFKSWSERHPQLTFDEVYKSGKDPP